MILKLLLRVSLLAFVPGVLMYTCTSDILSKSAEVRLKRYLFCDYDSSVRPSAHHSNITVINFALIPRFVEIDEYINSFDLHTWMILIWPDPNIEWESTKYDGINELHLQTSDIWVPDITVHNAGDGDDAEVPILGCWASNEGEVHCVPPAKFTGTCKTDHKWWPYERFDCTIQFASWSHSGDEISFHLINNGLFMNEYEPNNEWIFEKAYVTQYIKPFKMEAKSISHFVAVHFLLRRATSFQYATFIVPAIVLMVLTLSALWLEAKSMERSIIANINFICHWLCMMNVHWVLPNNGFNVPNIITFYNGSLALATFTLILTTCLRHLQELNTKAPAWVSSGTSQILKSKLGQILLLSILDPKASAGLETGVDDNTDLVQSSKKDMAWEYVAILIGWTAFFGTLLLYVVMLGVFLPKENSAS